MTTRSPRRPSTPSTVRTRSAFARPIFAACVGVVSLSTLVCPAAAQLVGSLPDSIVQADSPLTAADKAAIITYVETHAPGLSGTPEEISASRKALVRPFRGGRIGTSFRVEYADAVTASNPKGPRLKDLIKGANHQAAINAAYILGEIGAKTALDALQTAIKEREPNRPSLRLVAALGVSRTFDAVRGPGQSALSLNDAKRAIQDVEAAFRTETDADVADALIAALDSATRVGEDKLPAFRNDAAVRLAAAIQARVKDAKAAGFHSAYARAAKSLFDGVINENANTAFSDDAVTVAAGTAGDLIGLAVREVNANTATAGWSAPDSLCQIVRAAETLAAYTIRKRTGAPMRPLNLDRSLCGVPGVGDKPATPADLEKSKRDANELIGPEGRLTQPPFPFKPDRFN